MRKNLINIKNLSIRINGQKLVDGLDLSIKTGDRLGLIGNEGNGKSLLMKIMAGAKLGTDINVGGVVDWKGMIGYVPQELNIQEKKMTPREYLIGSDWDKLNDMNRWSEILNHLGLDVDWLERENSLSQCSGGEQVKLKLAKALFDQPDVLLLDEPTNYLDIDTLGWLENFCLEFGGGLIVISHDELFLEKATNRILHLERLSKRQKNVWRLENIGFAEYKTMRSDQFERDVKESARQRRKHDEQMKKLKEIKHNVMMRQITIIDCNARRLLNKKMKSILAQQAKLDNQELLIKPDKEKEISFWFDDQSVNQSKVWLDWRDKLIRLPVGELNIERWRVSGGDKVFVVGANGSGKTQFLKYVRQNLRERGARIGYVPQDYTEVLPMKMRAIDWLEDIGAGENVKTLLGAMNFGREEMDQSIGKLSSGQKMKVMLLGLKLQRPDILLLDEPMSNLSLFSRQELRRAIKEFAGPAIIVTHDRKFISEVADRVYEIERSPLKAGVTSELVENKSWKTG